MALACLIAATSCGGVPPSSAIELLDFRQNECLTVALNEELFFHFSEELERGSVTSESVRIFDELGGEVAGERLVRGSTLSFRPELACAPDLSDGGLRPDTGYQVVLGGFPRPDGIRSQSGALLSATLLLSFCTVDIGETSPLFLDPFVGPFPLRPRGKYASDHVAIDGGRILLECEEALDPSSVSADLFQLSRYRPESEDPELIPLRVELIVNRRDHAELLLEAAGEDGVEGTSLDPDDYWLGMVERGLRTLGGREVEPGWPRNLLHLVFPYQTFELDCSSVRLRSPEAPPGCDGTAQWSPAGTDDTSSELPLPGIRIRYPAAAGSGAAGDVEFVPILEARDLHTTHMLVPAGRELNLSSLEGPVVIRSQTSLEVRGRIFRCGESAAPKEPLSVGFRQKAMLQGSHWETLSEWIERALAPGQGWSKQPWTILIAGGDLRVPKGGAIEVNGPLLLVAGGWIRVEGSVYSEGDVWKTPERDGNIAAHGTVRIVPLRIDAPSVNPLRTPLRFGVLTVPLSLGHRAEGWRTVLLGHGGAGRVSADFLEPVIGRKGHRVLVSTPTQSGGEAQVRILLEVGVGHGEVWDPPYLQLLAIEPLTATARKVAGD